MDTIDAWREAHSHLILAIALTKDSINSEKAKRRLLLEELHNNLTPDGTSRWVKKTTKKSTARKRKSASADGNSNASDNAIKKGLSKSTTSKKKKKLTLIKKKQQNVVNTYNDSANLDQQAQSIDKATFSSLHNKSVEEVEENEIQRSLYKTEEHAPNQHSFNNDDDGISPSRENDNISSSYFQDVPKTQSPSTDDFFNYQMTYNSVLEATAIDAAAAIASSFASQSMPMPNDNSNQSNEAFGNEAFDSTQPADSFIQSNLQQLGDDDDDDDDDDFE